MDNLIQPKILKGFRDFLPDAQLPRTLIIEKLGAAFRSYGFVPIDTPALEYSEILLRKSNGETEKQVFRFNDNGGRDVALRFDLTVPFARFTAEHKNELYFPFKRYHIAKVWRGEKPQAGRYREFVQCDFDIAGSDSVLCDFEILSLIKHAFSLIGVQNITIKINHRGIFNAFLEKHSLTGLSENILRTVDKMAKIGAKETENQLVQITGSAKTASLIIDYISVKPNEAFNTTLERIEQAAGEKGKESVQRMRQVYDLLVGTGIAGSFVLDPAITRGLDYYTGIVYETFLNDLPSIGSVCSGGRYDNLAGLYMKEKLSGTGASIGLDRLLAALEQLGHIQNRCGFLDAEIFCTDESLTLHYQALAQRLRAGGAAVEVFPEAKKINQQYAVAEKKDIPFGIFVDKEQAAKNVVSVKNLKTREVRENISEQKALEYITAKR